VSDDVSVIIVLHLTSLKKFIFIYLKLPLSYVIGINNPHE